MLAERSREAIIPCTRPLGLGLFFRGLYLLSSSTKEEDADDEEKSA